MIKKNMRFLLLLLMMILLSSCAWNKDYKWIDISTEKNENIKTKVVENKIWNTKMFELMNGQTCQYSNFSEIYDEIENFTYSHNWDNFWYIAKKGEKFLIIINWNIVEELNLRPSSLIVSTSWESYAYT